MKKYYNLLIVLCFAFLLFVGTGVRNYSKAETTKISFENRWFSAQSPWNTPIGDAYVLSVSDSAIEAFINTGHTVNMNWDVWTPAVIYADSRIDRTTNIIFKDNFGYNWTLIDVPVNQSLLDYLSYLSSREDTDRKVCLYDKAKKGFFSLWQIRRDESGQIQATTGGFSSIDGPGWSEILIQPQINEFSTPSLGSAGGANYCGGLIRPEEIESGHIDHALAVQWPNFLVLGWNAEKPVLQFPASGTDGTSSDKLSAIPYGARLQLAPELTEKDFRKMGLNNADIIIARALQEYGGYIMDTTHGPGGIVFQNALSRGKWVYKTSPVLPKTLYPYLRFVGPPPVISLDNAARAQNPVPSD